MKLIDNTHGGTGVGQLFTPTKDIDFLQNGMLDFSDAMIDSFVNAMAGYLSSDNFILYGIQPNYTNASHTTIYEGVIYLNSVNYGSLGARKMVLYSPLTIVTSGVLSDFSNLYAHITTTAVGSASPFRDGSTAQIHNDLTITWNTTASGGIAYSLLIDLNTGQGIVDSIKETIIPATSLYYGGGNWIDDVSYPIKIKKRYRTITIDGKTNNSIGLSGYVTDVPLLTLPSGYRPSTQKIRFFLGDITQSTINGSYCTISTGGLITLMGTKGSFTNNQSYLSFSFETDL